MSHFGRSGPPDIKDTYSLLVLNITFRTTADDLFPLFDKYGKVVDIFIPRDRRTGESRGFAFVRYKYAEEAQRAVEKLDGRTVDGRDIMVQFAKYGPNAEPIQKGRIVEVFPKTRGRSRSRSPRPRHRDDHRDRHYRKRSRSRSRGRNDRDRYRDREKENHRRSRSRSMSPDYKGRGRGKYNDRRSRSRSIDSASPVQRSLLIGAHLPARAPVKKVLTGQTVIDLQIEVFHQGVEKQFPGAHHRAVQMRTDEAFSSFCIHVHILCASLNP
uniref:Serine/arginine-rich splicing factor 2 n=1 Tax=Anthurium amnicola TaxID=1678845 RepID=A0A1D1ZES2_9ARAE